MSSPQVAGHPMVADPTSFMLGDVLLLIPRNYCGVIHLRGRKKACEVLSSLASVCRVLEAKDHRIMILVGDPKAMVEAGQADDPSTDFCQLESRWGRVNVGFTGEDKVVPEPPGVWQKLGDFILDGIAAKLVERGVPPSVLQRKVNDKRIA